MSKSRSLRWALIGTGLLFAGLGLGSCNMSSLSSILPVALLSGLLGSGTSTST